MNRLQAFGMASNILEEADYRWVETPWLINQHTHNLTASGSLAINAIPVDRERITHFNYRNVLVGSAEQGFLQMHHDRKLMEKGRYYSESPCFRMDAPDKTHRSYFSKIEIHITDGRTDESEVAQWVMEEIACRFLPIDSLSLKHTDEGLDIMYNNYLELGSFGSRVAHFADQDRTVRWVYGTALAWPRIQMASQHYQKQQEPLINL